MQQTAVKAAACGAAQHAAPMVLLILPQHPGCFLSGCCFLLTQAVCEYVCVQLSAAHSLISIVSKNLVTRFRTTALRHEHTQLCSCREQKRKITLNGLFLFDSIFTFIGAV